MVARTDAQPVVLDQTIAVAGLDQPLDDLIAIEFAAGDKLEEPEGAAVERMVARAGERCGECFDLALERGPAVGAIGSCGIGSMA